MIVDVLSHWGPQTFGVAREAVILWLTLDTFNLIEMHVSVLYISSIVRYKMQR